MPTISSGRPASARLVRLGVLAIGTVLTCVSAGVAQMSPEEHASHHPGQGKEQAKGGEESKKGMGGGMGDKAKGREESKKAAGGGMGDMGKMMEGMGAPPPKELYPSLMTLPDLSPEKRDEVARQAGDRMAAGTARLSEAVDRLSQATLDDDYAAMQAATAQMREGLAEFESGLAARRALAEGRAPRSVALKWFKREMDLLAPEDAEGSQTAAGPSWFHLFTMVLLIAFAVAMVAMYFFKMRRAAALFGRIEAGKGPSPPGSAPPLAGAPGPSAPGTVPEGKAPPPEGTPPPSAPTPPSPPTPPAEKSPASGPPAGGAPPPAGPPAADAKAAPPAAGKGLTPTVPAQERPAATQFACLAPAARAVFLVGTFNGWDPKATPMRKDAAGNWDVAVALPTGRHEFKFVVDGDSCCEPGCDGTDQGCPRCVPNSSGTMNRLIEVT